MSGIEISRAAWDSCVFLAWFKAERDKPLAEIEELLNDIAKARLTLIVSAIVGAEILDCTAHSPVRNQFREFMKRQNVVAANVDFRIAELAASIRERANDAIARKVITKGLKAPDALIAATAITYRVDVLHTFDPDLLNLDQTSIVDGLRITEPTSAQTRMF
jgi:predicted nucleic acid-binding protein